MNAWKRLSLVVSAMGAATIATAQIPDTLSSFEMGGRGMGMGGAIYSNETGVAASYWNPAGLAYVNKGAVEINFRNKPSTDTTLTGNFLNPDEDAEPGFGRNQFSFIGAAVPFRGGSIGLSYAVGGYAREHRRGTGLSVDPVNGITANVDTLDTFIDEFITLAFGTKRGGMAFGAGVVFARQTISEQTNIALFQNGNPIPSPQPTDDTEDATGIGGIIGAQFAPGGNSNASIGISYRSEIQLDGYNIFSSFSEAIPARLQGGIIVRKDGLRQGRDYLISGVDAAYFFKANSGMTLNRKGHVSGGLGFEYNFAHQSGFIPIRLGVRATQEGGDGFAARTVVTFGLGYRPNNGNWWIDVAGAAGGGQRTPDIAFSFGTAIGK